MLCLQEIAQRNIVVKSFSNIPLADLEMIFPEKKVYIKPFVLIQLIVTIVLAFITVFSTLWQVSTTTALMLLGLLLHCLVVRSLMDIQDRSFSLMQQYGTFILVV